MFCILQAHKPELNRCAYAQHNEQCWVCKDYQAGKTKPAYPVPAFTCHAARYTTHCEEFGYKSCNVCAAYELGLYEPHYPVPAIRYEVVMYPPDSLYIDDVHQLETDNALYCVYAWHTENY